MTTTTIARRAALVAVLALSAGACADGADDVPSGGGATTTPGDPGSGAAGTRLNDAELAEAFVAALREGDLRAASLIATKDVVDFFEPWEPFPEAELVESGTAGVFFVGGNGPPLQCEIEQGLVARCSDEPTPEG